MKKYLVFCAATLLYVSCSHIESTTKYPNMIADTDPFSLGSINVSLDQTFSFSSKVKETVVEVIFYPRKNEVVLEFKHGMGHSWQFWNEAGRQQFINALNRYKEDFANQNLTAKYSKSRAIYGKINGWFQWKTMSFSHTYTASPIIELGYRFKGDAPYFSIWQKVAKEETGNNKFGITESPQYSMYFTRAQGEELARLFDQAFLLASLEGKETPAPAGSSRDEYYREANTPVNNTNPQMQETAEPTIEPIAELDSEESSNEE